MNTQDLHKALVATYGLPEDSMFCGPSPIQGYIAISIPLSAQVMRRLADAMDPQESLDERMEPIWIKYAGTTVSQRADSLEYNSKTDSYLVPWGIVTEEQKKKARDGVGL